MFMWHVEDPYELNCLAEFVPNPSTQTDPFAQDDTPTINCWSLKTNDSILDQTKHGMNQIENTADPNCHYHFLKLTLKLYV